MLENATELLQPTLSHKLPDATTVGPVSLYVPDLQKSMFFYEDVIGFKTISHDGDSARLGTHDDKVLLELFERPQYTRPIRRSPGLFHFAILLPSRSALGRAVIHLSDAGWALSGAGDHLVSEALYLNDPDGNGIELYADRPRETWEYAKGLVLMDTLAVDMESIIAEGREDDSPWHGLPNGTTIGHVHLKVSNLEAAERFYTDVIGFDLVATMPQARFVSAGGYHHHLGLNTWLSEGQEPSSPDTLGLRGFTLNVPSQADLNLIVARLINAGVSIDFSHHTPFVRDPSFNGVWLKVQPNG